MLRNRNWKWLLGLGTIITTGSLSLALTIASASLQSTREGSSAPSGLLGQKANGQAYNLTTALQKATIAAQLTSQTANSVGFTDNLPIAYLLQTPIRLMAIRTAIVVRPPTPTRSVPVPSLTGKLPRPAQAAALPPQAAPPPVFQAPTAGAAPVIEMRVAVIPSTTSVTIGASVDAAIVTDGGQAIARLPAMQALTVNALQGQLQVGNLQIGGPVWLQLAENGVVSINGDWYRGRLRLIPNNNGTLLVVNYVELEQYLMSVVGAEMPSRWLPEALKAQAVAARSYAVVHYLRPYSSWYDVKATERHQVYAGVASESNPSRQAVVSTWGVVMSFNGGIVETMYASDDEITRIAHWSQGFASMSQHGAQDMAQQGFNYVQILSRYYRGAAPALLQSR